MYKKIPGLFILAIYFLSCNSPAPSPKQSTPILNETGIEPASPKSVGMDSLMLNNMTRAIVNTEYPNIHSVLIVKNGKLVYENYFPGEDEIRGTRLGRIQHGIDSLHDLRSVTKSVLSACIGIAIAQGKIKSEDQKIWEFFPEFNEFKTGKKADITLNHLLTMTSGLDWNENIPYTNPANSEIQMDESDDPVKYVLSRKLVTTPGETWNYSGGSTEVLAATIKKATGLDVEQFAKENLFKPLGIEHYYWIKFDSTIASKNIPAAASGLRLRSRDMLKFGLLYMNNGSWNGKQVLPEAWVNNSLKWQVSRGDSTQGYGYKFWIFKEKIGDKQLELVTAVGNGDQRIFIDRQNKLLVIITAGNYNKWDIKKNATALVLNFIYPALLK